MSRQKEVCMPDITPAQSVLKTYRKEIWAPFVSACKEYRLIAPGDKIAVCLSGGKDSALLAVLMRQLSLHSDFPFSVEYIAMDPGYSPENRQKLEENAALLEIPVKIFETNIFGVTEKSGGSPCYLCARMRRGHLYSYAQKLGCNKIALGHHFSDVIETTVMALFWGAQLQAMPPMLRSTNYPGMSLIRPLYKIREEDIIRWKNYNHLDFLACACTLTANAAVDENVSKRKETKNLIKALKKTNPDIEKSIFHAIHRVHIDTFPAYKTDGKMHTFLEKYDISEGEGE